MTTNGIRLLLLFQAAAFFAASLVHFGILANGYEHSQAGTAEGVIGAVLIVGLILTMIRAAWTRMAALAVQGFALLGTFVGLFTIAIGVGPRTLPDLVFHTFIVLVLIAGLILTARSKKQNEEASAIPSSARIAH